MLMGLLWGVALALFVAGLLVAIEGGCSAAFLGFRRLFGMGGEMNVPAAFSTLLLLLNSGLLAVLAGRAEARMRPYWVVLGAGFFVMAADEWFAFHERLVEPAASLLVAFGLEYGHLGPLAFAWVAPAFVLVLVLAFAFYPFLGKLSRSSRKRFLLAGLVYLGGALGMEMAGGWYFESQGGVQDRLYVVMAQIEEFAEMSGLIFFAGALMQEMQQRASGQ